MKSLPVFCLFVCLKAIIPTVIKKRLLSYPRQAHSGLIIGYLRMDGRLSRCIFPAPQWVIFCLNSQDRNAFSTIWLMLTCYLSSLGDRGSKKEPPNTYFFHQHTEFISHRLGNPQPDMWRNKSLTGPHSAFYIGLKVSPRGLGAAGMGTSARVPGDQGMKHFPLFSGVIYKMVK